MNEFSHAIVFIEPDETVHHIVMHPQLPTVSILKHLFDELVNDEEFGVKDQDFIDSLTVAIVDRETLIENCPELSDILPKSFPVHNEQN